VLEAVPNVSEGRDAGTVAALADAFASRALVLDVHSDPDHNRSVFTLAGKDQELVDALLTGIAAAVERVDLRRHVGVHPRVGVADVVPIVPLAAGDLPRAVTVARVLAQRIGEELALPVFQYAEIGDERRPAFFRRGGLEELRRRVEAGELEPDAGPSRIDPRSGVVLVGAREPLVAYNVVLATDDVEIAREVARAVRGSSGGMPGVQAIGLLLPEAAQVQVSLNVIDVERAPLHEVLERVRSEADSRGAEVATGELVGLVPARVLAAADAANVVVPDVDASRVLENVLASRLAG
jgi:glutamate formiminotransferase / 5-formyltetrahydrofolate cyclo-ligase